MKSLPISQLPLIPPEEADSNLTEIFDEIRRTTETLVVFNMWQTLANYFETLADALKLEVDPFLQGLLPGGQLEH